MLWTFDSEEGDHTSRVHDVLSRLNERSGGLPAWAQVALIELRRKFDGDDVEIRRKCLCLGAPGELTIGEETVLHGLDILDQKNPF
jgi:hypothetical protein